MPSASRLLTTLRAHERASPIPKLHQANTVAWGLLRRNKCCMIVVSHWSKPAWQNMASLLIGCGSLHTPQYALRREVNHLLVKKPPLVRVTRPRGTRSHRKLHSTPTTVS